MAKIQAHTKYLNKQGDQVPGVTLQEYIEKWRNMTDVQFNELYPLEQCPKHGGYHGMCDKCEEGEK